MYIVYIADIYCRYIPPCLCLVKAVMSDTNRPVQVITKLFTIQNNCNLKLLALHCFSLSEYADENMMDPYNLAICFGPTLLPIPPDRDQVNTGDFLYIFLLNNFECIRWTEVLWKL